MINLQDYIADSKLFRTFKVDDLLFVEYRCLVTDDVADIWNHNNYIAYVLGGEKKWKTPGNEFKVNSGQALFVRKGANTVYQYYDEPFVVLFIFIPDEFIRNTLSKHVEINPKPENSGLRDDLILLEMNKILESFFVSLLAHFSKKAVQSRDVLKLKLEELVLNIFIQEGNHELKQCFAKLGNQSHVDLEEVMNENYLRQLTIRDYARLCGRSLASFRRDFERKLNTSPGKWLITKRLEYSKFLLETSDKQINEIIHASGFKNRSHFSRAFRQAYGVSPIRYKQTAEDQI